jgi:hypothetical protein
MGIVSLYKKTPKKHPALGQYFEPIRFKDIRFIRKTKGHRGQMTGAIL